MQGIFWAVLVAKYEPKEKPAENVVVKTAAQYGSRLYRNRHQGSKNFKGAIADEHSIKAVCEEPMAMMSDSPFLKGPCHDSAHVWAVTVADCLWTNRKRVRCTRGNLHNLRFIVREAGVFRTFMFDFIYPHNSYLFSGIPQINVAADKNKINNPVLLWNKHLPTCIFTYPR